MRVLEPADGVLAFYDGRVAGYRFAPGPNWVDDGALSLGIASYAVVSGAEAVVYDTHVSVDRARRIRRALEERGVQKFTVVLSHWHLDHVAGTAAFSDCEVIASKRTGELLRRFRTAIERGSLEGPPAIEPLVLPTTVFEDRLRLEVGSIELDLLHTDIHSDDGTVVWMPDRRLMLCGDTMEDTVTYVDEPQSLDTHLDNLEELSTLGPERILPNHGAPEIIAAGGYGPGLISATTSYIRLLQRSAGEQRLRDAGLRELIAESLASGALVYYAPYEAIHRHNIEVVLGAG